MELYLLRHGKSLANEQQLVCGSLDFPLSNKGKEQAAKICGEIKSIPFNHIYSSPLSRALDTIAGLESFVPVSIEEQLKELNTGDVSQLTLPELWARDSRFRKPWLSPELRYPGGETFIEMVSRISGWLRNKKEFWSENDKILIVGHEGTLRSIYLTLMQLQIEDYPDFVIGNCDYLYFETIDKTVSQFEHIKFLDSKGEGI
jgi:broad specificity phosphatase PhoE